MTTSVPRIGERDEPLARGARTVGWGRRLRPLVVVAITVAAACATSPESADDTPRVTAVVVEETDAGETTTPPGSGTPSTSGDQSGDLERQTTPVTRPGGTGAPRPDWLGLRPLPTTPEGRVEVPQTTPPELEDRRLATIDTLPPPAPETFEATGGPVPDEVLNRSTWTPGCPVEPEDLSYLTLTFWGFDGLPHRGDMIVHRSVENEMVAIFEELYALRFPIEEMRIVSPADLEALPTGDGNMTTAFVCRAVTGGSSFSEHAYGLAIDINPFHNPYQRGDLILPELATAYLDRSNVRPGMILPDDPVVRLFSDIGWSWGGDWRTLKDYQHFSHNGR